MRLLLALGLLPALALAQVPIYHSIESDVATSDLVAKGIITNITKRDSNLGDRGKYTITVHVDEVIKGAPVKDLEIENDQYYEPEFFTTLAAHHTQVLWCVQGSPGAYKFWRIVPLSPGDSDDGRFDVRAFTMDFSALTTSRAILDRARSFAKEFPDRLKTDAFGHIPELLGWSFRPVASGWMEYPAIPSIESIAQKMIENPRSFLPSRRPSDMDSAKFESMREEGQSELRLDGIEALRSFKSEKNIALLKKCLNDPYHKDPRAGYDEYPIRTAARRVLASWGIESLMPSGPQVLRQSGHHAEATLPQRGNTRIAWG